MLAMISRFHQHLLGRPQQDMINVLVGAGGIAMLRRRVDR